MQEEMRTSGWPKQQLDLAENPDVLDLKTQGLQRGFLGRETGREPRGFAFPSTASAKLLRCKHAIVCGPWQSAELFLHTAALDQVDTDSDNHLISGTTGSALRISVNSAATSDLLAEKMTRRDTAMLNRLLGTVGETCHVCS